MLEPKKIKHRKQHRNRGAFYGKATRGHELAFGSFGLKAQSAGELTARQIEAARRAMTHRVQRGGKIWIRVFPHTPVTKKAAEVPMGSGKGSVEYYAVIIRPGTMLFEIDGLPTDAAREALTLAGHKLPVRTKIVTRLRSAPQSSAGQARSSSPQSSAGQARSSSPQSSAPQARPAA